MIHNLKDGIILLRDSPNRAVEERLVRKHHGVALRRCAPVFYRDNVVRSLDQERAALLSAKALDPPTH